MWTAFQRFLNPQTRLNRTPSFLSTTFLYSISQGRPGPLKTKIGGEGMEIVCYKLSNFFIGSLYGNDVGREDSQ